MPGLPVCAYEFKCLHPRYRRVWGNVFIKKKERSQSRLRSHLSYSSSIHPSIFLSLSLSPYLSLPPLSIYTQNIAKCLFINMIPRLMCSKVFCVPSRRISRVNRNPERREASGCGDNRDSSKLLSVPLVREEGVSLSFSLDRGDSGKLNLICV